MRIIKSGTQYSIYDNSIETFERLPVGTYAVGYNQNEGCFLIRCNNITVTEKTYGVHNQRVQKVMNSFAAFERSLGVILSGDKGIGKSLFVKQLCENAVQTGFPVVIVDACLPDIGSFIESIRQECVMLFDEFDKTFRNTKDDDYYKEEDEENVSGTKVPRFRDSKVLYMTFTKRAAKNLHYMV